jgi:HPt (histidine-containing phosphotransfer) domain-containing protein
MEEILFNTALLDELGSKKSTMKVLEFYLTDSKKYLVEFERLISENDLHGFKEKSHKLKGSLGMLKADLLVSLLNQMEIAVTVESNFTKVLDLMPVLTEKLHLLDTQLLLEINHIKESL